MFCLFVVCIVRCFWWRSWTFFVVGRLQPIGQINKLFTSIHIISASYSTFYMSNSYLTKTDRLFVSSKRSNFRVSRRTLAIKVLESLRWWTVIFPTSSKLDHSDVYGLLDVKFLLISEVKTKLVSVLLLLVIFTIWCLPSSIIHAQMKQRNLCYAMLI